MAVLTVEDILDQLQEIADVADADGRELSEEEVARVEALEADLAAAKARRERSEAARKRIADAKAVVTPALIVDRPKGGDTIENAFVNYMRTGRENADIQELRNAQSEGVGSEGGFIVPDGIRQLIVERMVAFGGLANVVEEITTDTGQNLTWITLGDDSANRAEIVAEGGTFSGGADLSFGQAQLGAYSYMAGGSGGNPLRVSRELAQDSSFDVAGLVARKLGERAARLQAEHIVSGTGVGQPQGIVTGLTGVGTFTGASDTLVYADFLEVIHSVDPAYRANARWAFNDATLQHIRGLLDANDRPILKGGMDSVAGGPGGETLLGYPVTIDQAFDDYSANSSSVNYGVFGDLREGYVIRRVRQIELLVNPYSRMQYRQIEYSAWFRMDAVQQNTHAYVAITGTP